NRGAPSRLGVPGVLRSRRSRGGVAHDLQRLHALTLPATSDSRPLSIGLRAEEFESAPPPTASFSSGSSDWPPRSLPNPFSPVTVDPPACRLSGPRDYEVSGGGLRVA